MKWNENEKRQQSISTGLDVSIIPTSERDRKWSIQVVQDEAHCFSITYQARSQPWGGGGSLAAQKGTE